VISERLLMRGVELERVTIRLERHHAQPVRPFGRGRRRVQLDARLWPNSDDSNATTTSATATTSAATAGVRIARSMSAERYVIRVVGGHLSFEVSDRDAGDWLRTPRLCLA
jgi:hypothetical protein